MSKARSDIIPNQVFVGLPWKTVKRRYEHVIDRHRIRFPLSFVIVGRDTVQDARDLLDLIKTKIDSSSYAVFDATGGNANVSLEYGYAEARDIPRVLYLSSHKASRKSKEQPILSDLAGKTRQQYTNETKMFNLLRQFAENHPYTKRLERFFVSEFGRKSKGEKKRRRSLALKVIHSIDGQREVRRDDVVQQLLADVSRYNRDEIDVMIRLLHKTGLIRSEQGPHSRLSVR